MAICVAELLSRRGLDRQAGIGRELAGFCCAGITIELPR
jgi:hypothetical protein